MFPIVKDHNIKLNKKALLILNLAFIFIANQLHASVSQKIQPNLADSIYPIIFRCPHLIKEQIEILKISDNRFHDSVNYKNLQNVGVFYGVTI